MIYYGAATLPKKDLNAHVWVRDGDEAVVGCLTAKGCHILARYPERNQVCGDHANFASLISTRCFHRQQPLITPQSSSPPKKSATNLAELKLAGKWLARLAQTPDNFLRERMAGRWLATCQRSARLGTGMLSPVPADCARVWLHRY